MVWSLAMDEVARSINDPLPCLGKRKDKQPALFQS